MLSVFRAIARHARHLQTDLGDVKRAMRRPVRTPRGLRKRVSQLYEIEGELRDVCLGKSSITRFHELCGRSHVQAIERNEIGTVYLWIQHENRRFDEYNAPPARDSPEFKKVDRLSKFACASSEFTRRFSLPKKKVDPKRQLVVATVLTPYYKSQQQRPRSTRPRQVELRSVKRSAGALSLLRVSGVQMRVRGFRRHMKAVDTRFMEKITDLELQIWLAKRYEMEEQDDMTEWIGALQAETSRLRNASIQLGLKLEVQRRILARRRLELERDWEFRFRRREQIRKRDEVLNPKKLLTLESL